MNATPQGTRIELTDDLRQFVDSKLQDAFRAFGKMNLDAVKVDVELEKTTLHQGKYLHRYCAEANVSVPGRFFRAEASSEDLREALVEMKRTLTREIRSWRERLIDERRRGARTARQMLSSREMLSSEAPPQAEGPPSEDVER